MKSSTLLLGLLGLACQSQADPTWPSSIDELEEIMFQLENFRARKFADTVNPCTNEASGPGRQIAAEWLRTAFHDMSTASIYFGTGGLDASLQYELTNKENKGPGFNTTIEFMGPYISRKSSLSDLIAMGVYMSVRACGGPAVPIRAGRIDATKKGNAGVPQPENSALSLTQQFDRMGFSVEEMIQVTACGHTIGGVHSEQFPDIVLPGTAPDGRAPLDESIAVFDNKVVTEYLDGTTKSPLVIGPSVRIFKNSDFNVFNADGNVTIEKLAEPTTFQDVCKVVLQKMIDVVPPGVTLTDPIVPYMVKPVNLQLTLTDGGKTLAFSGYIRVKTTDMAKDALKSVTITYKNRDGASQCGSGGCTIVTTVQGIGQGFDDTFAFFPIEADIPASSGISSFTLTLDYSDGTTKNYDNNGKGYPLQDAVLFQLPQSCLLGSSGAFTVTAAVRNDRVSEGTQAFISYKVPQTNSFAPILKSQTIDLQKGDCVGEYTFFSADWTIPGGRAYEAFVDIKNGDFADSFKSAVEVGGTCRTFENPAACGGGSQPPASSSATAPSSTAGSTSQTEYTTPGTSSSVTSTVSDAVPTSSSSSAASPTETPSHAGAIGDYTLVGCWTEVTGGGRALSQRVTSSQDMTNIACAAFCQDFRYFATQFGSECYCGSHLAKGTSSAPLEDCRMTCAGDALSYCGGPDRLELYMNPDVVGGDPEQPAAAGDFAWHGCYTELDDARALGAAATAGEWMTTEACAEFCEEYEFFGTEYGNECFCGDDIAGKSKKKGVGECNMLCAGSVLEYCGAGNRLSVYKKKDAGVLALTVGLDHYR